jgi:hypothetical protein
VDQGRNFKAAFIQTACAMNGIEFQSIPTEAPWRMGVFERAHVPLKLAYNNLKAELPELDRELLLSMAVKCVNDAVGPSGVSPTYAVFGSGARHFPVLSKQYAATHAERVHAMETARKQIEKHHAKASVEARTHHGPVPGEQQLAVGDAVLTYRKDVGWIGPYKVTRLTDVDVEVLLPNQDRTTLERSQVRIYTPPVPHEEVSLDMYRRGVMAGTPDIAVPHTSAENNTYNEEFRNAEDFVDAAESSVFALNVYSDIIVGQSGDEFSDLFSLATKVFEQSPRNAERFAASRKREMEGLLEGNIFAIMRRDSAIANGDRIYKSRFVDNVKNHGTPKELPKSRFVLCG